MEDQVYMYRNVMGCAVTEDMYSKLYHSIA